ncbi:hypothetical protein MPSEU_000544100 [Mayamaea pseudoterrestris]|nr:hypothetical protein MPSEU_000544100 [Mayamaea pseudoterrestris]
MSSDAITTSQTVEKGVDSATAHSHVENAAAAAGRSCIDESKSPLASANVCGDTVVSWCTTVKASNTSDRQDLIGSVQDFLNDASTQVNIEHTISLLLPYAKGNGLIEPVIRHEYTGVELLSARVTPFLEAVRALGERGWWTRAFQNSLLARFIPPPQQEGELQEPTNDEASGRGRPPLRAVAVPNRNDGSEGTSNLTDSNRAALLSSSTGVSRDHHREQARQRELNGWCCVSRTCQQPNDHLPEDLVCHFCFRTLHNPAELPCSVAVPEGIQCLQGQGCQRKRAAKPTPPGKRKPSPPPSPPSPPDDDDIDTKPGIKRRRMGSTEGTRRSTRRAACAHT